MPAGPAPMIAMDFCKWWLIGVGEFQEPNISGAGDGSGFGDVVDAVHEIQCMFAPDLFVKPFGTLVLDPMLAGVKQKGFIKLHSKQILDSNFLEVFQKCWCAFEKRHLLAGTRAAQDIRYKNGISFEIQKVWCIDDRVDRLPGGDFGLECLVALGEFNGKKSSGFRCLLRKTLRFCKNLAQGWAELDGSDAKNGNDSKHQGNLRP